jgi:hypothetical protein
MGDDKNYPYSSYIKDPKQLGASPKGSMSALKKDIAVLGHYVDVLTSGTSKAHTIKGPLGNKYFLATDTECKDVAGVAHPRYVFINNIPDDVGGATGRGLVPGILQDMLYINPAKLFSAFTQSNVCREITMETRDSNNVKATEKQYVLDDDLVGYPASWFPGGKHPINPPEPVSARNNKGKKGKDKKGKDKKGKGKGKDKKKGKKGKEKFTNYEDEDDEDQDEAFTNEASEDEYEEDTFSLSTPELVFYVAMFILFLYLIVQLIRKVNFTKLKQVVRMNFK